MTPNDRLDTKEVDSAAVPPSAVVGWPWQPRHLCCLRKDQALGQAGEGRYPARDDHPGRSLCGATSPGYFELVLSMTEPLNEHIGRLYGRPLPPVQIDGNGRPAKRLATNRT